MALLQRTVSHHNPVSTERYPDINPQTWATRGGSSIFVKWIPDEMTDADAHRFFKTYGQIDRVEIVHKMKDGNKIGRMLFVHFDGWNETFLPHAIAQNHPNPVELEYCVTNRFNSEKIYKLKCCINVRPIPKVDYTTTQLTDMFENL
ncbi:RNA-binding protein, partial [bacterium]|nr:RNA-binding protein [bacterium]